MRPCTAGLDVLDRKLRILRREQEHRTLLAARTQVEWEAACRSADDWLLRAAFLGGRRAVRLAAEGHLADVRVDWTDAMGTNYPDRTTCRLPALGDSAPLPLTAALVSAREAYRAALQAGLEHATAKEAARILTAEVAMTGRRIRALRDRLLPRLEEALAAVELALDEAERSDGVRVHRAIGSGETGDHSS